MQNKLGHFVTQRRIFFSVQTAEKNLESLRKQKDQMKGRVTPYRSYFLLHFAIFGRMFILEMLSVNQYYTRYINFLYCAYALFEWHWIRQLCHSFLFLLHIPASQSSSFPLPDPTNLYHIQESTCLFSARR